MKDAPAFDFYAQRWLAGTMDMTAEERGAYINLLCRQWEDDGLADDPKRLAAVARCRPATLAAVLERFPVSEDGKRRNARLEITRGEQRARIAKSREKIEKMNAARASCRDSTRTSTRESCRGSTRPSSPLTTHHSPHVLLEKEPKGEDVALVIYEAYPKRVGKPDALKKIHAALAKPPADTAPEEWPATLLAITHRYAALRKDEPPQFTPNPSTWFNQRRFEDDPATWKQSEAPANTHQHTETLF